MTARRPSPRHRMRAVREWSGWSEAELAERIRRLAAYLGQPDPAVTAAMVAEWEAGSLVGPARLSLWCAAVGVPVSDAVALVDPLQLPPMLTVALGAGSVGTGEDMQRRDFLRLLASAGALATFDPARLESALAERAHVDLGLVTDLAASVRQLAGLWDSMPPRLLRRGVLAHSETARMLLAGPLPSHMRRELMAVGGHAAALAGATSHAMGRDDEARSYLLLAGQLSSGAGDTGMQALGLIWSADTLSGTQRGTGAVPEQAEVLAMLDRAEALAERSAPRAVRAYVALRQAEELAAAGETTAALRHLDTADATYHARGWDDETLYGTPWPAGTVHPAFRGSVEILSGRPAGAVTILQDTLSRLRDGAITDRSSIMADLGAAHARLGAVDAACDLLSPAWAIADAHGLEDRRARVVGIRRRALAPYATEPAVRRLDEAIASTL